MAANPALYPQPAGFHSRQAGAWPPWFSVSVAAQCPPETEGLRGLEHQEGVLAVLEASSPGCGVVGPSCPCPLPEPMVVLGLWPHCAVCLWIHVAAFSMSGSFHLLFLEGYHSLELGPP